MAIATDIRVLAVEETKGQGVLGKLVRNSSLALVGQVGFGTEAITIAQESNPDVILVSLEEPVTRSLRTIEVLSATMPNRDIIAVAPSTDRELTRKAVRAGARDYLTAPVSRDDLARTVRAVFEAGQKRRQLGDTDSRVTLPTGQLIVVFGVKGGVGKTTMAVNIATAMSEDAKERVALVDLEVQLGDVALMLDLIPEHHVADAAANADHLEPEYVQSLVSVDASGVRVLPAPTNPEESTDITGPQVTKILDALVRTFDYVVVDTSPSLSELNLAAIERATTTLIVTAPELSSIKRTKIALNLLLKTWNYPEERIKLIVNSTAPGSGMLTSDIESALGRPVYWTIPYDSAVVDATKVGRPCVESRPSTRYSRCTLDLSRALCGIQRPPRGIFGAFRSRS